MKLKTRLAPVNVFLIFLVIATLSCAQTTISGKVIGISDGDTITVLQNQTPIKIRLYGIDTPERGQDFGVKAKRFSSSFVFGKEFSVAQ